MLLHSVITYYTCHQTIKSQQQQQQFIYRFRLYKGLVPQIATKLVEAGQDKKKLQQIPNILEKQKT